MKDAWRSTTTVCGALSVITRLVIWTQESPVLLSDSGTYSGTRSLDH